MPIHIRGNQYNDTTRSRAIDLQYQFLSVTIKKEKYDCAHFRVNISMQCDRTQCRMEAPDSMRTNSDTLTDVTRSLPFDEYRVSRPRQEWTTCKHWPNGPIYDVMMSTPKSSMGRRFAAASASVDHTSCCTYVRTYIVRCFAHLARIAPHLPVDHPNFRWHLEHPKLHCLQPHYTHLPLQLYLLLCLKCMPFLSKSGRFPAILVGHQHRAPKLQFFSKPPRPLAEPNKIERGIFWKFFHPAEIWGRFYGVQWHNGSKIRVSGAKKGGKKFPPKIIIHF